MFDKISESNPVVEVVTVQILHTKRPCGEYFEIFHFFIHHGYGELEKWDEYVFVLVCTCLNESIRSSHPFRTFPLFVNFYAVISSRMNLIGERLLFSLN